MIKKSYIRKNLKFYDQKYLSSVGKLEALAFSKLALLELCGWIEISMDELIIQCAKKHLKSGDNLKLVTNVIVKKTYGFDYDSHFRMMLLRVIGLIAVETIERRLDQQKLQVFKSALKTLKESRDREAHTYLKGVARSIISPSVTVSLHSDVESGLLEFERAIIAYRP